VESMTDITARSDPGPDLGGKTISPRPVAPLMHRAFEVGAAALSSVAGVSDADTALSVRRGARAAESGSLLMS
jgi:hypothetical protein